ncbi:hypothetical protein ElyMa_001706200 [Elysia marginata]|uniref:Pecanex-like protein n=1 Tax=Elysia marginata TaxID=1093978 RepID=A0AAV4JWJ0_9GAST|nr:hypothetical protein ElyMa_001706200 [Elysia marginata]
MRSTGSLISGTSSEEDDDSVFDDYYDDDDDGGNDVNDINQSYKKSASLDSVSTIKKTPLFYFDEDGDITADGLEGEIIHQENRPTDLANQLKRKNDNSVRTSSGYNTEEDRDKPGERSKIPKRVLEKGDNVRERNSCENTEIFGRDLSSNAETYKNSAIETNKLGANAKEESNPPIIVELWDKARPSDASNVETLTNSKEHVAQSDQRQGFSREEREPTPFMLGPVEKSGINMASKLSPVATGSTLAPPASQPVVRLEREATPTPELGRKKCELQSNTDPSERSFQREATPFFAASDVNSANLGSQLTLETPKLGTKSDFPEDGLTVHMDGVKAVSLDESNEPVGISSSVKPDNSKWLSAPQVKTITPFNSHKKNTSPSKGLFNSKKFPEDPLAVANGLSGSGKDDVLQTLPCDDGLEKNSDLENHGTGNMNHGLRLTSASPSPTDKHIDLSKLELSLSGGKSLQQPSVFNGDKPIGRSWQDKMEQMRLRTHVEDAATKPESEPPGHASNLVSPTADAIPMQLNSISKAVINSNGESIHSPIAQRKEAFSSPESRQLPLNLRTGKDVDSPHTVAPVSKPVVSHPAKIFSNNLPPTDDTGSSLRQNLTITAETGSVSQLDNKNFLVYDPRPQNPATVMNLDNNSDLLESFSPHHNTSTTANGFRTSQNCPVITSRPPLDTNFQKQPPQLLKSSLPSYNGGQKPDRDVSKSYNWPIKTGINSASDFGNSRSARSFSTPPAEADVKHTRQELCGGQASESVAATSLDPEPGIRERLSQGLTVFMSVIEWIVLPPLPPDNPTSPSGVSQSSLLSDEPQGDQSSSSEASVCYDTKSGKREDNLGRSKKKLKLRAPRLSRFRRSRAKASSGNGQKTGAGNSCLTFRERLIECSPFGRYTSLAALFILVMTFVCLTLKVPVGNFVCYVLACFYAFCVLRNIGMLD